jgi:4-hydroxythreonine-4-phosphate dehydrogenase
VLDSKPLIGITLGDPNGVGPEVTLKALSDNKVLRSATPVVYGSVAALHHYRKLLKLDDWQLFPVKDAAEAQPRCTNVVTCWPDNLEIKPGQPTPAAGLAAWQSLKAATADLKAGKLQALVTGPINKHTIQNDEFRYPGHTEYFAEQFGAKSHLMVLVGDHGLRVG